MVYIAVINDLVTDQRVHRVAGLLGELGLEVTCIGRRLKESPDLEGTGFRARRYSMIFNRGPCFYACFNMRLFLTLLFASSPRLFIANDLDTLPAVYLAGRIRGVKMIYDSHEFFTQVPELIHRRRVQSIWRWIESLIVPGLEHAVTVSYSIATIYRRLYGTRFRVVRNVPNRRAQTGKSEGTGESGPRARENPCPGRAMILYQGALNVGRGLEMMIEAMQHLDNACLVLAGTGDIEKDLKQKVTRLGLADRVIFMGRMTPGDLLPLTCSADLGISLEEDLGLNYRYALPNKLFNYIQCRIPVLCSDLPEMKKIVESYGIGVVVRDRNPERVAKTIRYMLAERAAGAWKEALNRAADELCWENEVKEYTTLLRDCGITETEII